MPNLKDCVAEIRSFCAAHADKAVIDKYARYFTEGWDPWGVSGGLLEDPYREWVRQWKLSTAETLDLVRTLFSGKAEEVSLGIWFLRDLEKQLTGEHFIFLKTLFDDHVRNWGHCDAAVSEVISRFIKYRIITYEDFTQWKTSPVKWTRRAVPVSMIWIVKKDPSVDPVRLFEFAHPLVGDSERPVWQGMGWFLREAWKKHPAPIEEYLSSIIAYAPRLIIQYATEKMDKPAREKFRRPK